MENPRMFIYLSQLMGKIVVDKDGKYVGKIYDIVVKPSEVYPQSSFLVVRTGFPNRKYAAIAWQDILEIDTKETWLKIESSKISFNEIHNNKEELSLRRDILDQQVVDTHDHKVIRVNDVHLLFVDHALMVAHADISTRGLLRRLGFEEIADFLVRMFNKKSPYLTEEHLISWKYIQPLSFNPASMTIKIDVPEKQFNAIPAADLGDIFLDLNVNHQLALFKSLDLGIRARIFVNIDFKTQKLLIEELNDKDISGLLNSIPSDEATDFLEKLPKDQIMKFLNLVETKHSKKLAQLLGYSSDSAGGLMTTEYLAFHKDATIEIVLKQIRERTFKSEPAQFVYILDEGNHLIGATNFRRLISANPMDTVQKAAFPKIFFVNLNSSVKEVAYLMEKYKYSAIPVVDDDNVMQGIITVDDILRQLIALAWRRLSKINFQPVK
ncbi:MAG: CBS domain-containing protein [Candidatus Omnitrophica bacterium]|nr:CBS domain-containing protein [Candidatus Omnitrophota bacterium]MBU1870477.1 CBS domain-containing protein [Candidatus Omnitrophota bacterium]